MLLSYRYTEHRAPGDKLIASRAQTYLCRALQHRELRNMRKERIGERLLRRPVALYVISENIPEDDYRIV